MMEDRNGNSEVASATADETQRPRKYAFLMCADDESQINPVPMVIDFNHAKDTAKVSRTSPEDGITGTPMYIARTLEDQSPNLPATGDALVRPVPSPHSNYSNEFKERLARFAGPSDRLSLFREDLSATTPWQHELYHDVESVFWMIYVWLFFAVPSNDPGPSPLAPMVIWRQLVSRRSAIVVSPPATDTYHPVYNRFHPLIRSLTHYLNVDPYWFEPGTPRRDPEYVLECFQRIIHAFLVKNWNQDFLKTDKSDQDREVQPDYWTSPSSQ
ncbi:hypothetical protein ONZ45_g17816 [Pleurotus djamor]|nr:hypothetical protein ONZ45_g17816 [Pleurotus djamor]